MKNRAAQKGPGEISLGLAYEFVSAFWRQGGDKDEFQSLMEDKVAMTQIVALGKGEEMSRAHAEARVILGKDFISYTQIAEMFNIHYGVDDIQTLEGNLPDEGTLTWLEENGYLLIASPPFNCTMTDLRAVHRFDSLFHQEDADNWYLTQDFAQNQGVDGHDWLMVQKSVLKNSKGKAHSLESIREFPTLEDTRMPNATELAYAMCANFRAGNPNIFDGEYVATASICPADPTSKVGDGEKQAPVFLRCDDKGIKVSYYFASRRTDDAGIAVFADF